MPVNFICRQPVAILKLKNRKVKDLANERLSSAKKIKNDEFYTQFHDIQKEMNAYLDYNPNVFRGKTILLPCDDPEWSNFTKFFAQKFEALGINKLISTSYAANSKPADIAYQPTLFETESSEFDEVKTKTNGKIFTLTRDKTRDGVINVDDLEWKYLQGDGDFRSAEIKQLRDEADIIITNPPFSLFREFLAWIVEAKKDFVIIGSMNAITYKEVFPLIAGNKMWLGNGFTAGNAFFKAQAGGEYASGVYDETTGLVKFRNVVWFSNLDHGRRHEPMALMSEKDNLKFSKHIGPEGYLAYDNYDAIDVPRIEAIPSDFKGIMGVPITFLAKYNPDQFEILDANNFRKPHQKIKNYPLIKDADGSVNGVNKYVRILIRHKRVKSEN